MNNLVFLCTCRSCYYICRFCNTHIDIFFEVKWFMLNDLMSNLYFIFRLLWERWSSDWIWVVYRTSLTRPSHVLRLTIDSQSQCLAHLSVEQSIHSIPALLYYICKVCVREWGFLIVTDHLEERETHFVHVHVSLYVHGKKFHYLYNEIYWLSLFFMGMC